MKTKPAPVPLHLTVEPSLLARGYFVPVDTNAQTLAKLMQTTHFSRQHLELVETMQIKVVTVQPQKVQ